MAKRRHPDRSCEVFLEPAARPDGARSVNDLVAGLKALNAQGLRLQWRNRLGGVAWPTRKMSKSRFWRPSRPVIHLAAATSFIGQQMKNAGEPFSLETFLVSREFIECVLRKAEELETLIANNSQFPIKADQLIRFRII